MTGKLADVRLVPMTKEQRDAIGTLLNVAGHHMPMPEHEALAWEALDGWNNAPADLAEVVYRTVSPWIYGLGQEEGRANCTDAVLQALGIPEASA